LQHPIIKSSIEIRLRTAEEAEVVSRALKPDDKPVPPGLEVETKQLDNTVVVEIFCSRGFASFLATVDDVLRMAAASEKVLQSISPKHRDI